MLHNRTTISIIVVGTTQTIDSNFTATYHYQQDQHPRAKRKTSHEHCLLLISLIKWQLILLVLRWLTGT